MVLLKKQNENYIKIECEKDIALDIYDHFQFYVDGYKFTPQYKYGTWDGKIKLFSLRDYTFPVGLIFDLIKFLKKNEVEITLDKSLSLIDFGKTLDDFIDTILSEDNFLNLYPYDYQVSAFKKSLSLNKSLVLSPTASREKFGYIFYC